MLLKDVIRHPSTSRRYLERYVNDGSPSGFSTLYTTSPSTSPFELTPWFSPYVCVAPKEMFHEYGSIPDATGEAIDDHDHWLLIHPDMAAHEQLRGGGIRVFKSSDLKVVPTASGRTVQITNGPTKDYVKLHYAGVLGRVRRELPFVKAVAGPELSSRLVEAIDSGRMGNDVTLLREVGARSLRVSTSNKDLEWGMVWRESTPYRVEQSRVRHLFPVFSLFSFDRLATHHYPLLKQIIDFTGIMPERYVFDVLIQPLVRNYFELIQILGLQPEWNAQNLLVGFNDSFSSAVFVLRDLESIDKDLTMMDSLGIEHDFLCGSYKCIDESQYNYAIKHSFMFDFKLGESIIEPFLHLLNDYYQVELSRARDNVKELTCPYIRRLPADFFPKGKWFAFDRVLVDQSVPERPYVEFERPRFRL